MIHEIRWSKSAGLLLLVICATRPMDAELVQVELQATETDSPEAAAVVTATPVLGELAEDTVEAIVSEAAVPGIARMDLRPDITWRLAVRAEGYWAPAVLLIAGSEPRQAALELVPTSTAIARIHTVEGQAPPEAMTVRLRTPGKRLSEQDVEEVFECPVAEGTWRCEVASGSFDVRLRAPGFISHFFWERTLAPREEADFGDLHLRPGASITGWLVTDDDSPLKKDTEVLATPRSAGPGDPRTQKQQTGLTIEARAGERGFFHLEGLQPGAYVLTAEQPGFVPLRSLPVTVGEASETELREPLVLTRPANLRVYLEPPADPRGEPWKLQLVAPNLAEVEYAGHSDSGGTWTTPPVRPGRYQLMVADSEGARVAQASLDIAGPLAEHWIALDLVEVEGLITLGGEPLAARLAFGGSKGVTSITMEADEDGQFSGWLPRGGEWPVDVRSKTAEVFRRLRSVEVEPLPGSSVARVEIELPATRLEGDVVDADGQEITGATVLAIPVPRKAGDPSELPAHTRTEADGAFAFEGLSPATYRLQAIVVEPSRGRLMSDPLEVDLGEEDPFRVVRLVIGASIDFRGRLVVAGNAGIPGASVSAKPLEKGTGVLVPEARSGPDGRFRIRLPEGTESAEVTVLAPGFVLYREILPVVDGEETPIPLDQHGGGTLAIQPLEPIELEAGRALPWVVRADGIRFDFGTLSHWTLLNQGSPFGEWAEIPAMPSGGYSVCWPRRSFGEEPSCDQSYLPAYGRLEVVQGSADAESKARDEPGALESTHPGKE